MLLFCVASAQAAIEAYEFDSAQVEADYYQLINELRCLVCQNQNLSASDADLAKDLRRQTYDMLNQGKSSQQVVEYMVARYGDFVLYRPRLKTSTYLLWLGPFLLLLIVIVLMVRRLRGYNLATALSDEAMQEAKNLLQQEQQRK